MQEEIVWSESLEMAMKTNTCERSLLHPTFLMELGNVAYEVTLLLIPVDTFCTILSASAYSCSNVGGVVWRVVSWLWPQW